MKILTTPLTRLQAVFGQRSPSENAFLLLLPLVGLLTGLSSVFIAHVIAFLQNKFWGSGEYMLAAVQSNPRPLLVIIPLVGGLLVGLIGWVWHIQTRGAGTGVMIQALALRGGFMSLRETLQWLLAAIVTMATGGSLGREGPMMRLAGALGSNLGRHFKLEPKHLRMLVCAAAASALAAVYNAPIGGSMFALEILMGSFALDVFGPVVVASVISTLVFRSAMGDLPRFIVPHYELISAWELPGYLALGILGGIVSVLFVKLLYFAEDQFEKLPGPRWCKPVLGFGLLGVLGLFFPEVFGNGFDTVNMTLRQDVSLTLVLLLALPAAKMLATSLTFGCGGAGGLFMPTLFVGALLGGAFGHGVHDAFPVHTAEPGAYALVGMGAVLAGTTHAPITAIMMIFEQTNSYQIVLPLMFVCIVSHFTSRLLRGQSFHSESLRRRGVVLPRGPEASVMQTLRVADVMHDEVQAIANTAPFPVIVQRFLAEPHNNLYVTDTTGKFLGAIRLHALKEMLAQSDTLQTVIAHDLLDESFACLTPDDKLADTMETFWNQSSERLPVINTRADRHLIGWISKRDLFGVYSQEILQKRQLLGHFVVTDGDDKRDMFVELPEGFELRTVAIPAHCAGRTLAQLAPRSTYGVHVLAIKRRHAVTGHDLVEMPAPALQLTATDRLVVIGKFEDIAHFIAALATDFPNDAK